MKNSVSPFSPSALHGAKVLTCLNIGLVALRPDCVDMSRLPEDKIVTRIGERGVDPRGTASKEFDDFGVKIVIDQVVVIKIHKMLKEMEGKRL